MFINNNNKKILKWIDRSWETWCNVRDVWFDVHVKSRFKNGPADEETVYKIRLPFVFLRIFFEYVKYKGISYQS